MSAKQMLHRIITTMGLQPMKKVIVGITFIFLLSCIILHWIQTSRIKVDYAYAIPRRPCIGITYHTQNSLRIIQSNYSTHLSSVYLIESIEGDVLMLREKASKVLLFNRPHNRPTAIKEPNTTLTVLSVSTSIKLDSKLSNTNRKLLQSKDIKDRTERLHHLNSSKGYEDDELNRTRVSPNVLPTPTTTIAIALGITSASLNPNLTHADMLQYFPTFTELVPSFCNTVSCGYRYRFYFAYDNNDAFFTQHRQERMFIKEFHRQVQMHCPRGLFVDVRMLRCEHSRHPAWAQNDAAYAAYIENADYVYRVNDDSFMESQNWVELFIERLQRMNPPNVGVVGPTHIGGEISILTYDFTHRSHVEIFGFHYPRLFTDWTGDSWITFLYQPGRFEKLTSVKLRHSQTLGRRYENHSKAKHLQARLISDQTCLYSYLSALESREKSPISANPAHVIAMSLYGDNYNHTHGAVRNAQLRQLFYPSWSLRFYIPHPNVSEPRLRVPVRFVERLLKLGAQIVYVNRSSLKIPLEHMHLLVALDPTVSQFLLRHTLQRFSTRESALAEEWVKKGPGREVHMIRDHTSQSSPNILGLLGAQRKWFIQQFRDNNNNKNKKETVKNGGDKDTQQNQFIQKLHDNNNNNKETVNDNDNENVFMSLLLSSVPSNNNHDDRERKRQVEEQIWWAVYSHALFHDSVSSYPPQHVPFPPRSDYEGNFIGETFDGFGEITDQELHNTL